MVENSQIRFFAFDEDSLRRLRNGEALPASQLFRHQELFQGIADSPPVVQKNLLKRLHLQHFTDGQILVHVSEPKYREAYLLLAHIESCPPGEMVCRWPKGSSPLPEGTGIRHLIITDGLWLLVLQAELKAMDENGFTVILPEEGRLLGRRIVRRHSSWGIHVNLTQNGFLARGDLVDFSPLSFRVRLTADANYSFISLNEHIPCVVSLLEGERILFSGACSCIRQEGDHVEKELVLAPLEQRIHRFRKKKIRNPRLRVIPPPTACFEHPFFRKPIQRDIYDLSFTGFAVEEKNGEEVLMAGMIIPGLEICYAGVLKMTCDAQVVYRRSMGKDRIRYGLAILDMDFKAYRQLSHIMVHAGDPQARFTCPVEMDALWEFFFDTGFIYPKKYHLLQSSREEFKETYRRLYQEDQDIEAHFTYQNNGRIYGHVSIFRAYQRAWMVHHLAARPLNGKRTGLPVLKNVVRFFDGLYRYPSIRMDYMLFYFRPQNHFPNLFFGGFARDLAKPRACSLDLFAYLTYSTRGAKTPLPEGWQLEAFDSSYLPEIERFYRNASGGLLLDVLRLGQTDAGEEPIDEVYRRHGFFRQWRAYVLLRGRSLLALVIVNRSSSGLNLSELLNSITVLVTEPAELPWSILSAAMSLLLPQFDAETIPLMVYPSTYPPAQGILAEKQYLLWILDTQYGKEYLDYMEKKTKITPRLLIKYLLRKWVKQ